MNESRDGLNTIPQAPITQRAADLYDRATSARGILPNDNMRSALIEYAYYNRITLEEVMANFRDIEALSINSKFGIDPKKCAEALWLSVESSIKEIDQWTFDKRLLLVKK